MPIAFGGGSAGPGIPQPLGIDVWNSQVDPSGVTDWGPIINDAVSNGIRLTFSAHDYPFTTALTVHDTTGVIFEGESGCTWSETTTDHAGARLIWQGGEGSGVAFDANGSDSFMLRDLMLIYSNPAYDGTLITYGAGVTERPTSFDEIQHCFVGSIDELTIYSAAILIDFSGAVSPKISDCNIAGGQILIRGFSSPGDISNDVLIEDTELSSFALAALMNVGLLWHLENLTFEFNVDLPGNGIDSNLDSAFTSTFTMIDCWYWDFADAASVPLMQRSTNTWRMSHLGGYCDNKTGSLFVFGGPGAISLRDVVFLTSTSTTPIDLGSYTTALKERVLVEGCDWGLCASGGPIINIEGHDQVDLRRNGSGGNSSWAPQLTTIAGYERTNLLAPLPTVTAHSGAPSTLASKSGTDMAGMFIMENATGGAYSAGLFLDVVFGTPMWPADRQGQPAYTYLSVVVTPMAITGLASGPESAAAGVYAQVVQASDVATTSSTGFSIGLTNGMPAGSIMAFAYRVIQL
jgi:hypothetical protein